MVVSTAPNQLNIRAEAVGQQDELALPKQIELVRVPPIKCQGIKTKLVPFILSSIRWEGKGRWIEPFAGSAVVALNLAPQRALIADSNIHLARFYKDVAEGYVTPERVESHLQYEGRLLAESAGEHYYEVRERFNADPSSLDFIFLNRACFNGLIRFNGKGEFNVPFGKKPYRFQKSYITKIRNQVARLSGLIRVCDWSFDNSDWKETLAKATERDFVYADPPYFGRHTDYYNNWSETEAHELLARLQDLPCGFALSTWKENKYRRNPHLSPELAGVKMFTTRHFYHLGSTENLRNQMVEALLVKSSFAA